MNEVVKSAGDVVVKHVIIQSVNGNTLNITPQVFTIEIYEELNVPFTTGKLFILDGQNLTNFFPLTGNEIVSIDVITPGLEDDQGYTKAFFIYGCSAKIKQDRMSYYELKIISKEAMADKVTKISKKFKGNPADIVRSILKTDKWLSVDDKQIGYLERCSNSIEFISNWWSPVKCIQYAAERALNENGSPSYVFFENKHGFSFVSLDTMFSDNVIKQVFFKDNRSTAAADNIYSTSQKDVNQDYKTIIDLKIDNSFNYFDRVKSGYYNSEAVCYDVTTGQYTHAEITRRFDQDHHTNLYSCLPDTNFGCTSGKMIMTPIHNFHYDDYMSYDDVRTKNERQVLLSRLGTTKLTIKVDGRTDYNIGQIVTVLITKDQQILKNENPYDMLISGNYLISAVNHNISVTRKHHECVIELIKDSYAVDINHSTMNENSAS